MTTHSGIDQPDLAAQLDALQETAGSGDRDTQLRYVRAVHAVSPDIAQPHFSRAAAILNDLLAAEPDVELMVLTGWMLARGNGYAHNPQRAREMMTAAASAGSADAHFELSIYEATGFGGAEDQRSALRHLRQAAKLGHPRAMANLAAAYATGSGIPQDAAKARTWYERAADAGNARAALALSRMYATGEGGTIDSGAEERFAARARELAARRLEL